MTEILSTIGSLLFCGDCGTLLDLPHGDEATWDSRRRVWPVHRRAPGRVPPLDTVPPAYDELLRACLERNPYDRPTLLDVKAVLSELVDPA